MLILQVKIPVVDLKIIFLLLSNYPFACLYAPPNKFQICSFPVSVSVPLLFILPIVPSPGTSTTKFHPLSKVQLWNFPFYFSSWSSLCPPPPYSESFVLLRLQLYHPLIVSHARVFFCLHFLGSQQICELILIFKSFLL